MDFQYVVAVMSQCTCTKDKEITCIVHPTERSLKERIAELVVEVEMKNKEIRKWKDEWYEADREREQLAAELESLQEFCITEIRRMPPDYVAAKARGE